MTQKEFLEKLELARTSPNYYNNKYPYNCGYYDGERFSFDCWNLIKAILGGWTNNKTKGYFVSPKDFPTGDCTGAGLLKQCTERSRDFSKLSIPGTYLYLEDHPHAGVYVGDRTVNGKVYNVIECTAAWTDGVLYSYVDKKGRRFEYKGGKQVYDWDEYGLLPYVEYEKLVKPEQPVQPMTSFKPFMVRVRIATLNIRTGPGTNYKKTGHYTGIGAFTIVDVKEGQGSNTGWGKLKSGAGWISLDYVKKI